MPLYQLMPSPKQVRRDVRGVVLCVTAFLVTMTIVSVVVAYVGAFIDNPGLMRELSGGTNASPSAFAERLTQAFSDALLKYSGLASILGMLFGLPWFFLIRGKGFLTKDAVRVHSKVTVSTIALLFVFILGIQFFMTVIQVIAEFLLNQAGSSTSSILEEATTSLVSSIWGVLYVVVIGPICEELVFRGAVMRKLERYGANFALIVSSLIFGLYHMVFFQSMFAFLIGLVLGYTAGRFSLKWAILLHILNNGLATLATVFQSELFTLALLACYFCALVGTIIALVVGRRLLTAQKRAGAPSEPRVYARAFSSPWLIIYMVLTASAGILSSLVF